MSGITVFKSPATADVLYFADVAARLLTIVGKDPTPQGILTVAELPAAIDRLEAAIAADKEEHRRLVEAEQPGSERTADGQERPRVSLTQRALPLLAMLKEALANEKPVMWGV